MRDYKRNLAIIVSGVLVIFGMFLFDAEAPAPIGAPARTELQTLLDKVNAGNPLTFDEYNKFVELYNKEIEKARTKGEEFIIKTEIEIQKQETKSRELFEKTSEKLE